MPPSGPESGSGDTLSHGQVLISALPVNGAVLRMVPDRATLDALAEELGLLGLRKVRLEGSLRPEGARDWRLDARLGATVVQPCTVTLAPVTTRVEETVSRLYVDDWVAPEPGSDIEMPQDDAAEPLPRLLNLDEVLSEALSLALPLYPRAPEADFSGLAIAEPGTAPMTDEDARPFAGLAGLRDQLAAESSGDEDEEDEGPR